MEESILISVKQKLGIVEDDDSFDPEIIDYINTVFMILAQFGVGPSKGFSIEDKDAVWKDFIQDNANLVSVRTYMAHKVRLMFDPPTGSSVMDALNRTISELEWRLHFQAETSKIDSENPDNAVVINKIWSPSDFKEA